MSNNVTVDVGSIFLPLLTILFIGLKLTHYIYLSWFWVLSPILFPLLVLGGIGLFALLIFFLNWLLKN